MLRIKAALIEEFFILILELIMYINLPSFVSSNDLLRQSILLMSILVVVGKLIEAIIDDTICKRTDRSKFLGGFIRMLICFFFTSAGFFLVFCFYPFMGPPHAALILKAIFGTGYALLHLFVSNAIDKALSNIFSFDDNESIDESEEYEE